MTSEIEMGRLRCHGAMRGNGNFGGTAAKTSMLFQPQQPQVQSACLISPISASEATQPADMQEDLSHYTMVCLAGLILQHKPDLYGLVLCQKSCLCALCNLRIWPAHVLRVCAKDTQQLMQDCPGLSPV